MANLASGATAVFAWGPGSAGTNYGVTIDAYSWRSRVCEVTNNSGLTMFCPDGSDAEKSAFYSNVGLSCTVDRDPAMCLNVDATYTVKWSDFGASQCWDAPGYPTSQGFAAKAVGANTPPAGYAAGGLYAGEHYKNTWVWGSTYLNTGTAGAYGSPNKYPSYAMVSDAAWVAPFQSSYTYYSGSPYLYQYFGAYMFYKAAPTVYF